VWGSKSTGYVPFALDPDILGEGSVWGGGGGGKACSSCPARPSRLMPNQASLSHQEIRETGDDLRSYAQTTYKPQSQGFYLQLCTAAHFLGFLPLPRSSCFFVFSPTVEVRWGTHIQENQAVSWFSRARKKSTNTRNLRLQKDVRE
jgi:hypothetical protein